jgi:hypothetical protein
VAGPGLECLPLSGVGPLDSASLRRASDASLRRATNASGRALAPAPRTTTSTPWSPLAGGWGPASLVTAFSTMAMTPPPPTGWLIPSFLPHNSHCRHALFVPSHPFLPPLLDRRWQRYHFAGHLNRCLGFPWAVLSQRRSRSPSHNSQSSFCSSVHHRQLLFH